MVKQWDISGANSAECNKCGNKVFWVESPTGKNILVDPDGVCHWEGDRCGGAQIDGPAAGEVQAQAVAVDTSALEGRLDGLEKLLLKVATKGAELEGVFNSIVALVDEHEKKIEALDERAGIQDESVDS